MTHLLPNGVLLKSEDLIRQKQELVAKGDYIAAQRVKILLDRLDNNESSTRLDELQLKHLQEQKSLEENSLRDEENVIDKWDTAIFDFKTKSKQEFDKMYASQSKELKELHVRVKKEETKTAGNSKKLLELKEAERNLAKQERFMEAHKIQQEIKRHEVELANKGDKNSYSRLKSEKDRLTDKHAKQIDMMKMKFEKSLSEMEAERDVEIAK